MFALFIFIAYIRPLGSLPFCSSLLSPGEECPEAELAPAAQAKWKAFLAHQRSRWAYWLSLPTNLLLPRLLRAVWQAPRTVALRSGQEKLHLSPFPSKPIA